MIKSFTLKELTETALTEETQRIALLPSAPKCLKSETLKNILGYSKALSIKNTKVVGQTEIILN